MALHDFVCRACKTEWVDVDIPRGQRATEAAPPCPTCEGPLEWLPRIGRIDAGSGSSFVAFDTEILQPDGSHKTVHVDSLHQIRQIERESEQRHRNGEGQPMIWREAFL